ncbi:MAG: methylmalonyl Co-A mutase-associated GTPase MeaB [Planctomycetes bacterium]|nr:methylmalonyl Co-A mutase-associated GTPase MeaB [Planctomycetota bacterium]
MRAIRCILHAMDLIARIRSRDIRAIARALTLVENGDEAFLAALDAEYPNIPHPERIGITGPPGAGKSTLTSSIIKHLRRRSRRVGVVAVDPSSPFSGGALLGDRLRMTEHALDEEVFVRSMAARGRFGGLAIGSHDACDVLALAAFDPVIVETVGVGQSEVDIARLADTTVVVLTPAAGDSVQALKAGIMEIADVVAINKADREGSEHLEEDIKEALELRAHQQGPLWLPPVVRTVATTDEGVDELVSAIAQHRTFLSSQGVLPEVRAARSVARLTDLAGEALLRALRTGTRAKPLFERLCRQVRQGTMSPRAAVNELLTSLKL